MRRVSTYLVMALIWAGCSARADTACANSLRLLGYVNEAFKVAALASIYPLYPIARLIAPDYTRVPKMRHRLAFLSWLGYLGGGPMVQITDDEIDEATPEFEEFGEGDVIIVLDAFSKKETVHKKIVRRRMSKKYGDRAQRETAFLISTTDPQKFEREVARLSRKFGPIARVEIQSHGIPGAMLFGKKEIPISELFTTREAKKIRWGAHPKIRFHTCYTGNGSHGSLEMDALANSPNLPPIDVYAPKAIATGASKIHISVIRSVPLPALIQVLNQKLWGPHIESGPGFWGGPNAMVAHAKPRAKRGLGLEPTAQSAGF